MPKAGKQSNGSDGEKPHELFRIEAWVNVRLDEADKDVIYHWDMSWPDIFAWMGERVYAGYRFSFAYDDYSKACQLSIICRAEGDPNYGLAMSSRHPDPGMVFLSLWYKDVHKLAGNWADYRPTPDAPVWD